MVYLDPYFLIFKTKKQPHSFSEVRGCFFDPMLSRKASATNSLKWMYGLGVVASVATFKDCYRDGRNTPH